MRHKIAAPVRVCVHMCIHCPCEFWAVQMICVTAEDCVLCLWVEVNVPFHRLRLKARSWQHNIWWFVCVYYSWDPPHKKSFVNLVFFHVITLFRPVVPNLFYGPPICTHMVIWAPPPPNLYFIHAHICNNNTNNCLSLRNANLTLSWQ